MTAPPATLAKPRRSSAPRNPVVSLGSERQRPILRDLSRGAAMLALFIVGLRYNVAPGVPVGTLLGLVLIPVWLPRLRRFAGARTVSFMGLAAIAAGLILTDLARSNRDISGSLMVENSLLILGIITGLGVIVWARELITERSIGLAFGLGLLADGVTSPGFSSSVNTWKFELGIPVMVIVLAVVLSHRRVGLQLVALAALVVVSALNDSRSYASELALAASLLVAKAIFSVPQKRVSPLFAFLSLAATAFVVYTVGTTFLVEGFLGQSAQARSVEQIDRAGNIILGGRPEIAASFALFLSRFWGFGAGTLVAPDDISVAKDGMTAINYQPDNGYVENYMFGSKIELHSVTSDLWAIAGPTGILLAITIAFVLVKYLAVTIATSDGSALGVFLAVITLWNLGFGPLYTSASLIPLALGFTVLRRRPRGSAPPSSALGSSALGSSALGSSALGSSALGSSAMGLAPAVARSVPITPAGPARGPVSAPVSVPVSVPRTVTVMQSFTGKNSSTNPYLLELVRSLPSTVDTVYFSWREALLGRWDVMHVHWPELLLRGSSPLRRTARRVLTMLLLVRIRATGRRLVRTLHNVEAHEAGSRVERWMLRRIDRTTDVYIRLNGLTEPPTDRPILTIPHGHYRLWYEGVPTASAEVNRVATIGLIRPYKRVPELIASFGRLPGGSLRLSVVGSVGDRELEKRIRDGAEVDPRVELLLGFADDATLAREITRAEFVVLPYRQLHNSGIALLALSLDRPILVPDTPTTRALSAEFGHEWVRRYTSATDVGKAMRRFLAALARERRDGVQRTGPDLSGREWDAIAADHANAYRVAVTRRRGESRPPRR